MANTPNRGYVYPTTTSPATVPADLQAPLEQIDADVQEITDLVGGFDGRIDSIVGLNPDGTLPDAAEAQVEAIAQENGTPPGSIPIFATLAEAQFWELAHPGRSALTTEAPPDPGAWQAARPLFNQVGRSVTIPNDAGATYQIDGATVSGTVLVTPPVTVTVVAVARPGHVLAGDTEWSFDFVEVLSAYDAAAMNLDPQFYYRLDEGSAPWENRGSGSLELAGTSATQVAGIGGFAFSTSGEIRLRSTPAATAFSLAVIVKTDGSARIFNPWTPPLGIEMYRLPTETRARVSGPSQTPSDAFLPVETGERVEHYALTWDGTTTTAYRNGVVLKSYADAGPMPPQTAIYPLRPLGSSGYTTIVTQAGFIADFTRAWTPEEVQALAAAVTA